MSPRTRVSPLVSLLLWAIACALVLPSRGNAGCDLRYQLHPEYYAFPVGAGPNAVATGDWNEDGHLDVVAACADGKSLTLLLGSGGFHLLPGGEIAVGAAARWVAAGDMNADGHLDLATTSDFGTTLLVGDGRGAFRAAATYPFAATYLALADLDGDGSLDIALNGTARGIVLLLMRGVDIGSVQELPWAGQISLADFDEDGRLDLAATGDDVVVRLNAGDGTFGPPTIYRRDCPTEFILAYDFNADGHLDIFAGEVPDPRDGDQCASALKGRGDGTFVFTYPPVWPTAPVAGPVVNQSPDVLADIDGDGELDRLSPGADRRSIILRPGGETGRVPHMGISDPWSSELADVDQDGIDDLILTGDSSFDILLRSADGSMRGAGPWGGESVDGLWYALGDVNGDGKIDLMNRNKLHLGNGGGTFQPTFTEYFEGELGKVAVADLDEDGNSDVVAVRPENTDGSWPVGPLLLFRSNGDGTFAPSELGITAGLANLKDLDGDGHIDLLATGGPKAAIFYGRGDGTFAEGPVLGTGGVQYGDFDGDGRLDLVTSGGIYRNTGRSYERVGDGPGFGAVGDIDGDGRDDIIRGGYTGTGFRVYLSNGDGTFQEPRPEVYGPGGSVLVDRSRSNAQDIIVVTHHSDVHENTWGSITVVRNERNPNRAPITSGARAVVERPSPASRDLAKVSISGVSDPDGDAVSVRVTAITQDEPVGSASERGRGSGRESGAHCPDATIDAGEALLRWERDGTGNGRVYTLHFTATDECGSTSQGQATVCVRHDASSPECADDGQRYNSLACDGEDSDLAQADDPLLAPEPRAGGANLRYVLASGAEVRLEIYDLLGRRRATVANGWQPAGEYGAHWAGTTAGVYFARLTIGPMTYVRRFALLP